MNPMPLARGPLGSGQDVGRKWRVWAALYGRIEERRHVQRARAVNGGRPNRGKNPTSGSCPRVSCGAFVVLMHDSHQCPEGLVDGLLIRTARTTTWL